MTYIRKLYRSAMPTCPCGWRLFVFHHGKLVPGVHKPNCKNMLEIKANDERVKQYFSSRFPGLLKSFTPQQWQEMDEGPTEDALRSIPEEQANEIKRQRKIKLTIQTSIEVKAAWEDHVKPASGMDFAATQGIDPDEIIRETLEPWEVIEETTDGRLMKVDSELAQMWPRDDAERIIPPPCVNWFDITDSITGRKTGKQRVVIICANFHCCPQSHMPSPMPMTRGEIPDDPEILYGISAPSRGKLDEKMLGRAALNVAGEADFTATFYEEGNRQEDELDAEVTRLTGIPVDDIPEEEIFLNDLAGTTAADVTVARDELGVLPRRAVLERLGASSIEEVKPPLDPDLYDGLFDPEFERVMDEEHDRVHDSGRMGTEGILAGRPFPSKYESDPSDPRGTGRLSLRRDFFCRFFTGKTPKTVSVRGLAAATYHVTNADVTRHSILRMLRSIQENATPFSFREMLPDGGERLVSLPISHEMHPQHEWYALFVREAKRVWKNAPIR